MTNLWSSRQSGKEQLGTNEAVSVRVAGEESLEAHGSGRRVSDLHIRHNNNYPKRKAENIGFDADSWVFATSSVFFEAERETTLT